MVDLKDPVTLSGVTLVTSFLIFTCVLALIKPSCVINVDKNGERKVSTKILLSFSTTFSIVISIATLLLFLPKNIGKPPSSKFTGSVYESPYAT